MGEIPKMDKVKTRSWSVQDSDSIIKIHITEDGSKKHFQMSSAFSVENVQGSPNISKRSDHDVGQRLCIGSHSKSTSITPLRVGFVITHSTVDLPSKSAYRPRSSKHCEGKEKEEEPDLGDPCECSSDEENFEDDFNKYEGYVNKYEADDEMSDNDWCCGCEDLQSPDPSVVKFLDSHDWEESKDWDCDCFWEDAEDEDFKDNFDFDYHEVFDSHGDGYETPDWDGGNTWNFDDFEDEDR
ncbi:unnamed protein product [Allacma fusca]|uniref:Uncharacterized protein n=1 Tax=Allacma fusca TaxID=39272 RepID=A0A8J2NKK1_9HEXA|nr:unnamed protein product [Allacma fusca]